MRWVHEVAAYWAQDFQVVRLKAGTKIPWDKEFQKPWNRMTPEQAESAWARDPSLNLGLIPLSGGCVVIDLDGRAAIDWFADTYGFRAMETATVRSPRPEGGLHLWYRAPEGDRRWTAKLAGRADIDVKARGFALVPPSSTIDGRYQWVRQGQPIPMPEAVLADASREGEFDLEFDAPSFVMQMLDVGGWVGDLAREALETSREAALAAVRHAVDGTRNNTLFGAACDLIAVGADEGQLNELRQAATAAGLGDEEIERTIQSARERTR